MPGGPPQRRPRAAARAASIALVAATAAATLASCAPSYSSSARHYPAAPGLANGATHPTAAQQAATIRATQGYRHDLLVGARQFTAATSSIARRAAAGDLAGARRAELLAQSSYDLLRAEVAPQSATEVQLDGEAWSTPTGSPRGLHAIEEGLWARVDLSAVTKEATALEAESLVTGFVFGRLNLAPAQILARAQAQLAWAVDVAVAGREELYSHLDSVDVVASARSAERDFELVAPLGALVAPAVTATVAARLHVVDLALGALGTPATRSDPTVPIATWRAVAVALDAAAAPLGVLGGALSGYGSGRVYA